MPLAALGPLFPPLLDPAARVHSDRFDLRFQRGLELPGAPLPGGGQIFGDAREGRPGGLTRLADPCARLFIRGNQGFQLWIHLSEMLGVAGP